MNSHFFTLNESDLQLHYLLWQQDGTASDTCCLLLHGFTNDAHIWDGLSRKLYPQMDVVALDFRGHGDSDWDKNSHYSHQHLLSDVKNLIAILPYKKIHIIGHSLGARVAMLLIARTDISVASFTIIDTGPEVRAVGVDKVRKDAQNTPASFTDVEAFKSYLSAIYLFAQPDKVTSMAEHGLKTVDQRLVPKTDPAFTAALWKPESDEGDSSDLRAPLNEELWMALAKIKAPTLILKGQASAILAKKTAEKMAYEVMHDAELIVIKQAGHAIMVDNPEAFEDSVCNFIQKNTQTLKFLN